MSPETMSAIEIIESTTLEIGDEVRFAFRIGNARVCGYITAIGYDVISGCTLRVTTRSPLLPTGWYAVSFWKVNETSLIED